MVEITTQMLIDKGASNEMITFFKKHFKKEVSHEDVLKKFEDCEITFDWGSWLLLNFKLSGRAAKWYASGKINYVADFKKGNLNRTRIWEEYGPEYFEIIIDNGEMHAKKGLLW